MIGSQKEGSNMRTAVSANLWLIVVLVGCALVASPRAGYATSIPMGFISWDVTVPGVLGQFDIANETGPNSSGDATAPVVTPVPLGDLALNVLLSNGQTTHFGPADFTLNPFDGLSFESTPLAIGGQNPLPIQATLTGTFLTTTVTLFDGSQMTILPDFLAIVSNGGQPLNDGDLAIIFAEGQAVGPPIPPGPTVPEPTTLVLTALGLATASVSRYRERRKRHLSARPAGRWMRTMIVLAIGVAVTSTASAQVRMNVSTQPSAGIAGTSTVNAIGSGFPLGHGSIGAGDITVSLTTTCGGPVVASTTASSTRVVVGSQYRVGFSVPSTVIAGTYFVALSGSTSDGTSFASAPDSCSEVHVTHSDPRLAACTQSSALSVNAPPNGGTVTAFAANGCWGCSGATGVQAVVIEGTPSHTTIATPSVVNTCATNPSTGKTVCLANNTDVYVIEGGAVTATLHSASTGLASQSGGACNNCGVAIDAVNNRAVLSIGLDFTSANPFHSGLQFLDLNTNTFSTPIPARDPLSEAIVFDPFRGFILSPNSASNYALLSVGSDGGIAQFWNRVTPVVELDGAAEDCSTGIAIGSNESTSSLYLADLTQATLQPGTPGTWTAPQQFVTLADWSFNTTGISVAQGSHLGIILPEGVNGRFAVLRLPDRSGTGTPTIVDHAVGQIPGFVGSFDPHPITAYTSPNDGKAYGVLSSGVPPTVLARVDLECILALPRVAGKHTVDGSVSACLQVVDTGNAPLPPPTIISTPVTTATAGQRYRYKVIGHDDTAFALTYSLPTAPVGMVIDPGTGQIDWSPDLTQAGANNVTVAVQNLAGLTGTQSFQVTVSVVQNKPPVITSSAPTAGTVGQPYLYQVVASDPDNRPLTYVLLVAPSGMVVGSQSGLIQWTPAPNEVGFISASVLVQDDRGLTDSQSFQIHVATPQNHPPVITSTAITSATVGQQYAYQVRATDPDGDPLAFSFVSAPVGMTIDPATGLIQWTPDSEAVGDWTVTVRAQDPGPLVGTQQFQLHVTRAYPVPTITIVSPEPGSLLNKPVDVVAIISDPSPGNPSIDWAVDLQRGDNRTRRIGSGSGAISGTIAQIDPTLLRDDSYTLVVTVSRLGQTDRQAFDYSVFSGNLKLGNFTTTFTDIAIPVAGIPLVISRVYDSLDVASYEFGAGWRLALPGQVTDSARETPLEPFTQRTRVYVTRPDGKREGFTFSPTQPTIFPIFAPGFTPDPGVTDTLTVAPADLANTPGGFVDVLGGPYNPSQYTLTTKQGVQYVIDEVAGLEQITDRNGNTLTITPQGLVSSTGLSLPFERDGAGRITKITEPGGGFVTYAYDPDGNLVSSLDQMQHETKYYYEDQRFPHYLTRVQDPLGRPVTRNVYDDDGRLVGQCSATGDPLTLAGCAHFNTNLTNKLQTVFSPRGFRTDLYFDDRGNVLTERHWMEDGTSQDTVREFDDSNHLLKEYDPAGNQTIELEYDPHGNIIRLVDPSGSAIAYTYGDCNAIETAVNANHQTTTYQYDDKCRITTATDANHKATTFSYTTIGQLATLIDPTGSEWHWQYDPVNGQPTMMSDPESRVSTYSYDSAGNIKSHVDRDGRVFTYAFDQAHHITAEQWADTQARVTSYSYWPNGALRAVARDGGSVTFTYTDDGYIDSVVTVAPSIMPSFTLKYTNDPAGNVLRADDSYGGFTVYEYDALDRTTTVREEGNDVPRKNLSLQYDLAGSIRRLTRGVDGGSTTSSLETTYQYECDACPDRLSELRHALIGGATIHAFSYRYDALAALSEESDQAASKLYSYDLTRQLTRVDYTNGGASERYTYDGIGNRLESHLSAFYEYSDKDHRLTGDDDYTYSYDGEGNRVEQTNRLTGERQLFEYDYANHLVLWRRLNNGTETDRATYTYDAIGRRIESIEDGVVTRWMYDGITPILKLNGSNLVVSRRLYASGDVLVAADVGGTTRWILTDRRGDVRDVLDGDGHALAQYSYDAFGNRTPEQTNGVDDELAFLGREQSAATRLVYLGARYYDPQTGRFLSEDPIGFSGGDLNNYRYAFNDPVNLTDPAGEAVFSEKRINDALSQFTRDAIECFGEGVFTKSAEEGVYILVADRLVDVVAGAGSNVYVGRTLQGFEARFQQHEIAGKLFNRLRTRSIGVSRALLENKYEARTLEQLLIDSFKGGRPALANRINASQAYFCR
jgi:RHS repeat-associated protein